MTLTELDHEIRRLTREHPEARPFLCEGSPIGCDIFLVGINPGTDTPFWPYWRLPYGCHKQEWLKDYLQRHGRFLQTRARIERLFEATVPVRCLETNMFFRYSPDESSLPDEDRDTSVFDYLLAAISPKVMFIHGDSAIEHMEGLTGKRVRRDEWTRARVAGVELDVMAGYHLRYRWSYERVDRLGIQLRERCQGRTTPTTAPLSSGVEKVSGGILLEVDSASIPAEPITTPPKPPASRSHREELIEVAEDCPVDHAVGPPAEKPEKTVARIAYEVLTESPYGYTEIEFFHEVHVVRRNRPDLKIESYNIKRSPLVQTFGWGIHRNPDGKLALVAMESDRYRELQGAIKRTKSYRKRKP